LLLLQGIDFKVLAYILHGVIVFLNLFHFLVILEEFVQAIKTIISRLWFVFIVRRN